MDSAQPVLVILFAFNILFIGYLLTFNRDSLNRSAIFTNVFMALMVIVLLSAGMDQANEFTDDAVEAINYNDEASSLADDVITNNITDISVFDLDDWNNPDLEDKNHLSPSYARDINITSPLTEGSKITEDEELSNDGKKILEKKIETLGDGSRTVVDLQDGNWITDITQEYYYRYDVDWINLLGTLGIITIVLVTIAIKLARLFFELAFNHVLAPFVAASDMHSGQRTKQVVQNILNIFLVTIMIFLSLKVYMIGASWLGETLSGISYLIAMIGFGLALLDGPNIVERIFGIDAGSKSGWGALAATYVATKGAAGMATKGASAAGKLGSKVTSGATKASAGGAGMLSGLRGKGDNQQGNVAQQAQAQQVNGKGLANSQDQQGKGQGDRTHQAQGNLTNAQGTEKNENQKGNGSGTQEGGPTRPQSLHDEMKVKGAVSGADKSAVNAVGSTVVSSSAGAAGKVAGNAVGSTSSSVSAMPEQNVGQPTEGAENVVEGRQSDGDVASVSEQHQFGAFHSSKGGSTVTGSLSTSSATTGSPSSSVSGNAASINAKGASVTGRQQASSSGSGQHKEVIEQENEIAATTDQEIRNATVDRGGASGGNTSSTISSTGGTSTPSGGSTTSIGGSTSSVSAGSSGSTTTTTTTQQTTTNVSGGGGNDHEVIQEENVVVHDDRHAGQVIRDSVTQRLNNNQTVQGAKKHYNIGKNTGQAIQRNVKKRLNRK
nr:hypothetical protein [Alteribacillus bidgolensis]